MFQPAQKGWGGEKGPGGPQGSSFRALRVSFLAFREMEPQLDNSEDRPLEQGDIVEIAIEKGLKKGSWLAGGVRQSDGMVGSLMKRDCRVSRSLSLCLCVRHCAILGKMK